MQSTKTALDSKDEQKSYDNFGRFSGQRFYADGKSWVTSLTYDQFGRKFQEFDASGNSRGIQYSYQNGYATSISEAQNTDLLYYEALSMDARGNIVSWELGNGIVGFAQYNDKTGLLESLSGYGNGTSVQDNLYEYDGLGNLRARVDRNTATYNNELVETFEYDELNRLMSANALGINILSMDYYDNGSIKSKSDVSSGAEYLYGIKNSQCTIKPGKHAVSSIGSQYKFCYDVKGNQTRSFDGQTLARTIEYTGFDKPNYIKSVNAETWFSYDANYSKFKRIDRKTADEKITYYIGNIEVIYNSNGVTEFKRYIGDFAIDTIRSNGTKSTNYLLRDHIGSIAAIIDEDGNLKEKLSFDAFGKRREGSSWNSIQNTSANINIQSILRYTNRGFTDHEHVEHANIIHMGGRIYDPTIGRFVQADPIVQAPQNGQSLNRYSYVFNNPLSFTDPTGYVAEPNTTGHPSGGASSEQQVKIYRKKYVKNGRAYTSTYVTAGSAPGNGYEEVSEGAFSKSLDEAFKAAADLQSIISQTDGIENFSLLGQDTLNSTASAAAGGAYAGALLNKTKGLAFGASLWQGTNVSLLSLQTTGVNTFKIGSLSDFKNTKLTTSLDASSLGKKLGNAFGIAGLALSYATGVDLLLANKITTGEFYGKAGADTTMFLVGSRGGLPGATLAGVYFGVDSFYGDNSTSGVINFKRDFHGSFKSLHNDIRRAPTLINRQIDRQRQNGPQNFLQEFLNAQTLQGPNK